MADWLRKHIISLAMTPGADEAPHAFRRIIRSARRAARMSGEPEMWRYGSIDAARDTELNASGIALAAKELGPPEYAKLTRERVKSLRRTGASLPFASTTGFRSIVSVTSWTLTALRQPANARRSAHNETSRRITRYHRYPPAIC